MGVINTGIDHGYHDIGVACSNGPGLDRVNVCARGTTVLAGIMKVPLSAEERIIRNAAGLHDVIRPGVKHGRILLVIADRFTNADIIR